MSAITRCAVVLCVFSVPLFYHMSATAQRLLLSFIYVHRQQIPPSAVANFVNMLSTSVSTLPTSEWIKMLLDLLKIFCSDNNCHGESVFVRRESESDDVCRQTVVTSKDVSSKLNTDQTSSTFGSLINDEPYFPDGSLLLEPFCNSLPGCNGQQMKVDSLVQVPDMETETSTELPAVSSMVVTQPSKTDDIVQTHTGNVHR